MSMRHRILNIGTGFATLWLAWLLIQTFLSPMIAQGLRFTVVVGIAAVVLNIVGERIIRFLRGGLLFTPRLSHRKLSKLKPANMETRHDDSY